MHELGPTVHSDVFTGAPVVAISEGYLLEAAVRFGNATGTIAVAHFSTLPAMPTCLEIKKFNNP